MWWYKSSWHRRLVLCSARSYSQSSGKSSLKVAAAELERHEQQERLSEMLWDACDEGDSERARALLKQGARADFVDAACDDTPLHCAVYADSVECVKLLLEAGAGVNARDCQGCTPLHYAAQFRYGDVAAALLRAGADPSLQDGDGRTPFELAVQAMRRQTKRERQEALLTTLFREMLAAQSDQMERLKSEQNVAFEGLLDRHLDAQRAFVSKASAFLSPRVAARAAAVGRPPPQRRSSLKRSAGVGQNLPSENVLGGLDDANVTASTSTLRSRKGPALNRGGGVGGEEVYDDVDDEVDGGSENEDEEDVYDHDDHDEDVEADDEDDDDDHDEELFGHQLNPHAKAALERSQSSSRRETIRKKEEMDDQMMLQLASIAKNDPGHTTHLHRSRIGGRKNDYNEKMSIQVSDEDISSPEEIGGGGLYDRLNDELNTSLRGMLAQRGLPIYGNKQQLVQRLYNVMLREERQKLTNSPPESAPGSSTSTPAILPTSIGLRGLDLPPLTVGDEQAFLSDLLHKRSLKDLRQLAIENGIHLQSSLKKAELVRVLLDVSNKK